MKVEKEIKKPHFTSMEAFELIAGQAINIYGCIILHIAGKRFQFAGTKAAINKAIATLDGSYVSEK